MPLMRLIIFSLFLSFTFIGQSQDNPIALGKSIGHYFKTGHIDSIQTFIPTAQEIMAYAKINMPDQYATADTSDFISKYPLTSQNFLKDLKDTYSAHQVAFWENATLSYTYNTKVTQIGELSENQTTITSLSISFRTETKVLILDFKYIMQIDGQWHIGDNGFSVSVNGK